MQLLSSTPANNEFPSRQRLLDAHNGCLHFVDLIQDNKYSKVVVIKPHWSSRLLQLFYEMAAQQAKDKVYNAIFWSQILNTSTNKIIRKVTEIIIHAFILEDI